jgi:hypothetical protein
VQPLHLALCDLVDYSWARGLTPVVVFPYEHGKSTLARALILWLMTGDQRLRHRLISASRDLARRGTGLIREVLTSKRFQQDFPAIVPSRPWTPAEITLERASEAADATLVASGLATALTGVRADVLVLDDIETETSSYSDADRQRVRFGYRSRLRHRIARGWGRALIVCTRQHPDDTVGQILRDPVLRSSHAIMIASVPTRGGQRASRVDVRVVLPPPHAGLVHHFGWATARPELVPDLPDEAEVLVRADEPAPVGTADEAPDEEPEPDECDDTLAAARAAFGVGR